MRRLYRCFGGSGERVPVVVRWLASERPIERARAAYPQRANVRANVTSLTCRRVCVFLVY